MVAAATEKQSRETLRRLKTIKELTIEEIFGSGGTINVGNVYEADIAAKMEALYETLAILRGEITIDGTSPREADDKFQEVINDVIDKRNAEAGEETPYQKLVEKLFYDPGVVLAYIEKINTARDVRLKNVKETLEGKHEKDEIGRFVEKIKTFDTRSKRDAEIGSLKEDDPLRTILKDVVKQDLDEIVELNYRRKVATDAVDSDATVIEGDKETKHSGSYYFNWKKAIGEIGIPIIIRVEGSNERRVIPEKDKVIRILYEIHATYMELRDEHPDWITWRNTYNERSQRLKQEMGGSAAADNGASEELLLRMGEYEERCDALERIVGCLNDVMLTKDDLSRILTDYTTKDAAAEAIGKLETKYDAELKRLGKELEGLKELSEKYGTLEAKREETARAQKEEIEKLKKALEGKADTHQHPYAPAEHAHPLQTNTGSSGGISIDYDRIESIITKIVEGIKKTKPNDIDHGKLAKALRGAMQIHIENNAQMGNMTDVGSPTINVAPPQPLSTAPVETRHEGYEAMGKVAEKVVEALEELRKWYQADRTRSGKEERDNRFAEQIGFLTDAVKTFVGYKPQPTTVNVNYPPRERENGMREMRTLEEKLEKLTQNVDGLTTKIGEMVRSYAQPPPITVYNSNTGGHSSGEAPTGTGATNATNNHSGTGSSAGGSGASPPAGTPPLSPAGDEGSEGPDNSSSGGDRVTAFSTPSPATTPTAAPAEHDTSVPPERVTERHMPPQHAAPASQLHETETATAGHNAHDTTTHSTTGTQAGSGHGVPHSYTAYINKLQAVKDEVTAMEVDVMQAYVTSTKEILKVDGDLRKLSLKKLEEDGTRTIYISKFNEVLVSEAKRRLNVGEIRDDLHAESVMYGWLGINKATIDAVVNEKKEELKYELVFQQCENRIKAKNAYAQLDIDINETAQILGYCGLQSTHETLQRLILSVIIETYHTQDEEGKIRREVVEELNARFHAGLSYKSENSNGHNTTHSRRGEAHATTHGQAAHAH